MKRSILNYSLLITNYFRRRRNGFTFIELLVVITIIAVLSMIAVVSYSSANIKARDGKRKADIEQIRAALEMYRTDHSAYPVALSTLTTTYIQSIPTPPSNSKTCAGVAMTEYSSRYSSSSPYTTYSLCVQLEEGGGTSYTVYNP